jgi:hypothetical protein
MKVSSVGYEALSRLEDDRPLRIPKGSKINYDNVALEMGLKKGAIKKGRGYDEFRLAIDEAAKRQQARITPADRLREAKSLANKYQTLWEQSIGRELCLARQVRDLSNQVEELEKQQPLRIVK